MRAILALALIFGLLTGCASSPAFTTATPEAERTGRCEQRSPEVFAISGEIDAALATCVRDTFEPTTRIVAFDTEGGSVEAALDIVEVLQDHDLIMRVEGECNSSCANYFLPLARRIELAPNAMILLHGSIDPWTLARFRSRKDEFMATRARQGLPPEQAEATFERQILNAENTLLRQEAFAARHDVRPGWLLYRTPGSGLPQGLTNPPTGGVAILVEEPMMRSCLPDVEIVPFQRTLERRWTRSFRRLGLFWVRIVPSGRAVCTG